MGLYDYFPETQALQQPDILGNYLRGAFAPGQLTAQQQQNTMGGLQIQQLRMALGNQSFLQNYARQQLTGEGGNADVGSASPSVGRTGGIQNGPQDSVSGTATAPPSPASGYAGGAADSGSGISAAGSAMSPGTIRALSILRGDYDPIKTEQGIFEYQKQVAQLKAQGPMDLAESVASSPNADQIVRNNPSLQQQWIQLAPKLGLNPFTDLTPQNARAAAILGYNNIAGSVGLPGKPMPDQVVNGAYGSQISAVTGKRVTSPELPEYTYEKKSDVFGKESYLPMVKKPGFSGTGLAGGAGQAGAPVDAGVKEATEANEKATSFGAIVGANLPKMEAAEANGVFLSPKVRTQLLDVVVNESDSALRNFLSQEALRTIPQDQRNYIYAAAPFLQAVAHEQAGARGMQPTQVRANLEGMIPQSIDKDNPQGLKTIHDTREAILAGLDAASGPLGSAPAFQGTVGTRRANPASYGMGAKGAPGMPSLSDIQAEMARRKQQ